MDSLSSVRRLIAEQILIKLRHRIKTSDELLKYYLMDNSWCIDIAKSISRKPSDWNMAIVEDAAYYQYERELC